MAEFVGLQINLIVAPGGDEDNRVKITGIVASVDATSQRLTLKQGIYYINFLILAAKLVTEDGEKSLGGMVQVTASDIRDLKIQPSDGVEKDVEKLHIQKPVQKTSERPVAKAMQKQGKKTGEKLRQVEEILDYSQLNANDSDSRRRKRTPKKHAYLGVASEWTKQPVSAIADAGDFDFEASHASFNKKAVFEEIRRADQTRPEDRLVAHNKNPMRKLGIREMVLDDHEREELGHVSVSSDGNDSDDEQSSANQLAPRSPKKAPVDVKFNPATLRQALQNANELRSKTMCRTATGITLPAVTWRSWERLFSKQGTIVAKID
jgi:hypothetical protein